MFVALYMLVIGWPASEIPVPTVAKDLVHLLATNAALARPIASSKKLSGEQVKNDNFSVTMQINRTFNDVFLSIRDSNYNCFAGVFHILYLALLRSSSVHL